MPVCVRYATTIGFYFFRFWLEATHLIYYDAFSIGTLFLKAFWIQPAVLQSSWRGRFSPNVFRVHECWRQKTPPPPDTFYEYDGTLSQNLAANTSMDFRSDSAVPGEFLGIRHRGFSNIVDQNEHTLARWSDRDIAKTFDNKGHATSAYDETCPVAVVCHKPDSNRIDISLYA